MTKHSAVIARLKTELEAAIGSRSFLLRNIKSYEESIKREREAIAANDALVKEISDAIAILEAAERATAPVQHGGSTEAAMR